jgi:hypothetical protein
MQVVPNTLHLKTPERAVFGGDILATFPHHRGYIVCFLPMTSERRACAALVYRARSANTARPNRDDPIIKLLLELV